jgi:hypothetical protein
MRRALAVAVVGFLLSCSPHNATPENKLPQSVEQVLAKPEKVTLYSLEPDAPRDVEPHFYGYKLLGQTDLDPARAAQAISVFRAAVSGWDHKVAICFNPRHALRVTAEGKSFVLLLCYECHQMQVFGNEKTAAALGAAGSPKALNDLLIAANIPVATMPGSQ